MDKEHETVTGRDEDKARGAGEAEHWDNVNEGNKSDYSQAAGRSEAGNITTDSDDAVNFDLLRTLCRGRRHRNHSSSSSGCSCESCISHSDDSFFESDGGPPGGENTILRRLYMWLENAKLSWGFLVLGLLVVSVAFTVTVFAVAETTSSNLVSCHTVYWMEITLWSAGT
ncbi:hypothetical protein O3P69_018072 [Scylla paramamosain]|uniref:Uncharacterized protein n=1 Tax=Scylla paramamosain TaxID=85552 RepID=A0AAW0TKH9_SCYPA